MVTKEEAMTAMRELWMTLSKGDDILASDLKKIYDYLTLSVCIPPDCFDSHIEIQKRRDFIDLSGRNVSEIVYGMDCHCMFVTPISSALGEDIMMESLKKEASKALVKELSNPKKEEFENYVKKN